MAGLTTIAGAEPPNHEGQMKKSILFAALLLGACVSHDFSEGERTNYRCDGGSQFSSREVAGSVEVYAGGQTQRLMPNGEDSYSNGTVTLTKSGGRSTLTGVTNGSFENCRARASQSWWPNIW
jgi:hypothetical protein